jgi:hypothetical protein
MKPQWLAHLETARDKILVAQSCLDETISFSELTDSTEEQLLRLSEHCSKMITHLNMLMKLEKEKVNV